MTEIPGVLRNPLDGPHKAKFEPKTSATLKARAEDPGAPGARDAASTSTRITTKS